MNDETIEELAEQLYLAWMGEPWPRPDVDEWPNLASGAKVRWRNVARYLAERFELI